MAAVRAGTGLVKLAFPAGIADIVESRLLEAVKFSLPETPEGTIAPSAVNQIIALSRDAACVAIGPGLGAGPASQELVRALLPRLNCPVVIDADAISCLADSCELLREMKNPVVLTPHPGEMSRLVGRPAAEVDRDRVEVARGFAADHQVIVVLKGAPTVIAAPGEPAFLNPTGGSGLATGGTGDVLTGLIAGLLAQGCRPLDAATAGVWLHGKAGDLGSEALTPYSLCAGDLLDYLPEAFAAALTPAGEA
jgi:NAD(P)H-hydrate epimerase